MVGIVNFVLIKLRNLNRIGKVRKEKGDRQIILDMENFYDIFSFNE